MLVNPHFFFFEEECKKEEEESILKTKGKKPLEKMAIGTKTNARINEQANLHKMIEIGAKFEIELISSRMDDVLSISASDCSS